MIVFFQSEAICSLWFVGQEPSSNDTFWGIRTYVSTNNLYGLTFLNSAFVTLGISGNILTSSDGTSWNNKSSGTTQLNEVTYGNSTFITVGQSGSILSSSDNGTTWTSRTSGTTENLYGVTYKE